MDGETVGENTEGLGFRPQVVSVSARPARVILIVGLAALVVAISWLVYAASRSRSASVPPRRVRMLTYDRPFPAEGRFEQDPYVGSKACAQCHPGEAALHSRSGHAMTLGPAGRRPLARRLDGTSVVDPDMPNVQWTYRFHDDALYVGRKVSNKLEECIAEYAFGSGHHATTFVSVIDADKSAILEHRLTHYAHDDALGLTPGHDVKPPPPGSAGRRMAACRPARRACLFWLSRDPALCLGQRANRRGDDDTQRLVRAMSRAGPRSCCGRARGRAGGRAVPAFRPGPVDGQRAFAILRRMPSPSGWAAPGGDSPRRPAPGPVSADRDLSVGVLSPKRGSAQLRDLP